MNVKLSNVKGTWNEVVNRARVTVNKEKFDKEPSDIFKRKILRAEHSPIRSLIYCFEITNVKSWVVTHLVRHHVGVEKWVRTQRTDRTPCPSTPWLCSQASVETREVMEAIKKEVEKKDPIMAEVMVKECVYRGYCPEMWSCGYDKTEKFKEEVEKYRNIKG